MLARPHFTRAPPSPLSSAAPPPTMAKSVWQPFVTAEGYSISLASRSVRLSLRPLMPPCTLHHFVNATAVSHISFVRPGRIVEPLSLTVPTLISESVTPLSGEPDGLPSWHTSLRSPKEPLSSRSVDLASVVPVLPEPSEPPEPPDSADPPVADAAPPLLLLPPALTSTSLELRVQAPARSVMAAARTSTARRDLDTMRIMQSP